GVHRTPPGRGAEPEMGRMERPGGAPAEDATWGCGRRTWRHLGPPRTCVVPRALDPGEIPPRRTWYQEVTTLWARLGSPARLPEPAPASSQDTPDDRRSFDGRLVEAIAAGLRSLATPTPVGAGSEPATQPSRGGPLVPRWDRVRRELWLGGELV